MQKIYNEGRVVGLSAYELYVRHSLSEYPEQAILTEREWLTASLGDGVSMILKIAANTPAGVHDFALPNNSTLCAAKTITASLFNGVANVPSGSVWATKVTSYGPLIDNSSTKSPTTPGQTTNQVPSKDLNAWDSSNIHMLRDYMKVIDGITFQPGTWTASGTTPTKDFTPDLSKPSVVRLRISKKVDTDFYILLSGFLFRPIVAGLSKLDTGCVNTQNPQNGDFLGVETYPWANKIVFTVPSEVYNALNNKAYKRKLDATKTEKSVATQSVIDFESADPGTYYGSNHESSAISVNVTDMNTVSEGEAVLATYQRSTDYPPVVYGGKYTSTGTSKMYPIDIAAPGTVKIFKDADLAKNYRTTYPNTFAMYSDAESDLFVVTDSGDLKSLTSRVEVVDHANSTGYAMQVTAGDNTRKAVSLQDKNGKDLDITGKNSTAVTQSNTTVSHSTWVNGSVGLSWSNLLDALKNGKLIDVLGSALRTFRTGLPNIVSGDNGVLDIKGEGESKIGGKLTVADNITSSSGTLKSGTNYIVMSNGLRLYISNTAPSTSGVPDGSIGIGW